MDNLNRNLQSLTAEYRDNGKAVRGLKNIKKFIDKDKIEELKGLLRSHEEETVYGQELEQRFDIDALIEFYNLSFIAALAGYVPGKLNDELRKEIVEVLGHSSVKPYYEKHYPYKMTELTLKYVSGSTEFTQQADVVTISVFNEFVSLYRMLKTDKDLERFLGMLDHVTYGDKDIDDLNEILSSFEKLNDAFTTKNKSGGERAVWGFVKYTAFLSQLKEMLQQTESYPLLQSSLWLFHGYYFERMNAEMQTFFSKAFSNVENALASPQIFNAIAQEIYNDAIPETFSEEELITFSKAAVQQAREDVTYVLNDKWGDALKNYFL
ncbi:MAG: hypothetical protein ABIQ40_12645 [Bacteroidia bacterium]